jgi:hypothetical protein
VCEAEHSSISGCSASKSARVQISTLGRYARQSVNMLPLECNGSEQVCFDRLIISDLWDKQNYTNIDYHNFP